MRAPNVGPRRGAPGPDAPPEAATVHVATALVRGRGAAGIRRDSTDAGSLASAGEDGHRRRHDARARALGRRRARRRPIRSSRKAGSSRCRPGRHDDGPGRWRATGARNQALSGPLRAGMTVAVIAEIRARGGVVGAVARGAVGRAAHGDRAGVHHRRGARRPPPAAPRCARPPSRSPCRLRSRAGPRQPRRRRRDGSRSRRASHTRRGVRRTVAPAEHGGFREGADGIARHPASAAPARRPRRETGAGSTVTTPASLMCQR
ncbi:hypothetical protein FOHLNKBM_5474 [Methylobacterium longum]|nr:hypothetical protein FOHLNKBM_5474 [Methylobacterium longum]